jgi:RND family efflux transporter MFP subunit
MRILRNAILAFLILAAGGAAVWFIYRTEPEAQQRGAMAETAMLVETTGVDYGTFRPTIRALGTVEAAQDITLSSRVSGYIVDVSNDFEPGSLVEEGDVLVELDRTDFQNRVSERHSALEEARANLEIEQGRQDVARSDLELINSAGIRSSSDGEATLSEQDRDLVLREPQRKAAQARVDAAETALRQARLELQRARVLAPYDAQVLSRQANVGSQVTAGDPLGRLVGTDAYWVIATLPQSRLRWLQFREDTHSSDDADEGGDPGSGTHARVRDRTSWPEGTYREGELLRPIGALEQGTRLARVLVEVPDPLAREAANADAEQLLIGAFVQVELEAREVSDVARIPRDLIRNENTVWVMEDGKLRIREVTIAVQDVEYAYISEGLTADDRIVATNLASVVEGAPLRVEGVEDSNGSSSQSGDAAEEQDASSSDGGSQ